MLKKLCTRGLIIIRRCLYVRVTDVIEQVQVQSTDFRNLEPPSGFLIRRFDIANDFAIREQLSTAQFLDFSQRAKHSVGYILWQEDEVAGYLWSTEHPRAQEGQRPFLYDINPPPHALYFYDLQVLPRCRLKGAGTALIIAALKDAAASNKTTVFATRASWNQPMERVFRKLGFQETGRIELKRVLGIRRCDLRALHV